MRPEDVPFLQLTFAEAREVVSELEAALDAHRRWLGRFQEMLVCRKDPGKGELREDGHLQGEFGRWYYRGANAYLKLHPLFGEVGRLHRALHKEARRLAKAVDKGKDIKPADYRRFAGAVDEFKRTLRAMFVQPREMLRYFDPLTGIANRYAMLPRLEQELERIRRTGDTGCVVMADLDRFKAVNDTHGHQAGDVVLQAAARFLQNHLRKYDQLYRYGGEEFLLLLPNTLPDQAKRIVERLRRGLARHAVPLDRGPVLKVTASFGIAELNPQETVQAAVEHADAAMYAAKQAGRNCTRLWGEGDSG
ncbi:MAG: diguanylate cyclase [Magnetospirillum sp. WYHS-4]